jgi:small GTP-binding protein
MFRNVVKTSVIGTTNIGKSCLCNVIAGRKIEKDYSSTIGVDFIVKYIVRKHDTVLLALWDLSGLDRFYSITGPYIESSSVLIYCYSAENYDTFTTMVSKYYDYNSKYTENKHIIIVVTKIDSNKTITDFEKWGEEFAEKHSHPFIKTSSYTKEGIQELIDICIVHAPIIEKQEPVKYWCTLI